MSSAKPGTIIYDIASSNVNRMYDDKPRVMVDKRHLLLALGRETFRFDAPAGLQEGQLFYFTTRDEKTGGHLCVPAVMTRLEGSNGGMFRLATGQDLNTLGSPAPGFDADIASHAARYLLAENDAQALTGIPLNRLKADIDVALKALHAGVAHEVRVR